MTLKKVLIFFTGADSFPPSGYNAMILNFNSTCPYPLASVCGIELTIPTKHSNYEHFKSCWDYGFNNHGVGTVDDKQLTD